MKDEADLSPGERALGYHNPQRGDYRLGLLTGLLRQTLSPRPIRDPQDDGVGLRAETSTAVRQTTA
jgi:hypothetical protein